MPAAKKSGHTPGTHFGDVTLVNVELMPVLDQHRLLDWRLALWLWIPIAVSPWVYSFACKKMPLGPSLLALSVGLCAAALLAMVIGRSSARFGVGFVPMCRSSWGARGALVVATARWLVGVSWMAVWAHEIGASTGELLQRGLPRLAFLRGIIGSHVVPWLLAAAVVVAAWWVAKGGLTRVSVSARLGSAAAVVAGFGLIVMAGIASKGFGPWLERTDPWQSSDVMDAAAVALLLAMVGGIACGDWERFRHQPRRRNRQILMEKAAGILAPLALVGFGVLLAFAGALLASAAQKATGSVAGGVINHVAAFGGTGLAFVAVGVAFALWIAVAPLVGMYSSALAVCGVRAQQFTFHRAALLTTVATLALIPLSDLLADAGVTTIDMVTLLAAPIGVMVVDELLVRRGRVLLDDLFTFSRFYGPVVGFSVAGILALVAGWALHPRAVAHWGLSPSSLHPFVGNPLSGMVVAAGVYLVFGSLERLIAWRLLHPKQKKLRRRVPAPSPLCELPTAGVTDPRYVSEVPGDFVVGPVAENPRANKPPTPPAHDPASKKDSKHKKQRRAAQGEVSNDAQRMADDEWWSADD